MASWRACRIWIRARQEIRQSQSRASSGRDLRVTWRQGDVTFQSLGSKGMKSAKVSCRRLKSEVSWRDFTRRSRRPSPLWTWQARREHLKLCDGSARWAHGKELIPHGRSKWRQLLMGTSPRPCKHLNACPRCKMSLLGACVVVGEVDPLHSALQPCRFFA